jgi:Arm DNA-binding domain
MARKLTTKAIEHFKPGPQRREIGDGGSGLYLIVQPSGARSWAVRYRHEGRPAKLTLGSWPAMSLAAARKGAADALHELARKAMSIERGVRAACSGIGGPFFGPDRGR